MKVFGPAMIRMIEDALSFKAQVRNNQISQGAIHDLSLH
jgi:hypothetical protein